jgi:2-C-methyl-D-erythritol 2,4-cyclodiphosphate synthase
MAIRYIGVILSHGEMAPLMLRVGQGYDVHRFREGDHLVIGGVRIAFEKAFDAHSDGDVLIHAVCDALLGAAALGDIGQHFPDTDETYAGIDSRRLLRQVGELLETRGLRINNVDATVIAQAPRLGPHIEAMRQNIAADLGLTTDRIGIKATTTERLGFEGRGEGIAAQAVALLEMTPGHPDAS